MAPSCAKLAQSCPGVVHRSVIDVGSGEDMNAHRQVSTEKLAGGTAAKPSSRAESIFRTLNRRAASLAVSDDANVAQSLSASASAMIADSLCRLASVEPESCSGCPAATPDGAPMLRLVGGLDD
jgi:hypothetical protein